MKHNFQISIEVNNKTGDILAVYFQIREGKSAETREFENGNVFVDYNRAGDLLGIEMLAPTRISVLDKITVEEPETRRFVKQSVPKKMVLAGT